MYGVALALILGLGTLLTVKTRRLKKDASEEPRPSADEPRLVSESSGRVESCISCPSLNPLPVKLMLLPDILGQGGTGCGSPLAVRRPAGADARRCSSPIGSIHRLIFRKKLAWS